MLLILPSSVKLWFLRLVPTLIIFLWSKHFPFGLIIQDCKRMLESLSNVSVSDVKKSGNKAAHWLARSACSFPGRFSVGDDSS